MTAKKTKSNAPKGVSTTYRLKRTYEAPRHVQVATYKGKISLWLPGLSMALTLSAEEADAIARQLQVVAKVRRQIDAYAKKHKLHWVD